uniref:RNA-dependent RNA polymerase n=1 Tax=Panagrolaimus sp. ES5 TaxID=591445 RepID=A0AC34EZG6_9BILA
MDPVHGSPLLSFNKNDFDGAPLTCSTSLRCPHLSFGFTAGSAFFQSGLMHISSATFLHDLQSIEIMSDNMKRSRWKLIWRYSSFKKVNLEILQIQDLYSVQLTHVVKDAPFISKLSHEEGQNNPRFSRSTIPDGEETLKKLVSSSACRMVFCFTKEEQDAFLGQLYNIFSCPITYSALENKRFDDSELDELDEKAKLCSWEVRYHIEAIKSLGMGGKYLLYHHIGNHRRLSSMNRPEISNRVVRFLHSMYEHFKSDISLSSLDLFLAEHPATNVSVKIKTICITPTRMIYGLDTATSDCRAFRFLGEQNLIQIKFCDENLSFFPRNPNCIKERVERICTDGINICEKQYFEIGASSSLFREHGSIFYATDDKEEIPLIWKSIGVFKEEPAAKVAARIGLFFSSSMQCGEIMRGEVLVIDDIESDTLDSAGKPYCFSDGCGSISYQVAENFAAQLGLDYVPSAFQIRFCGFKGMLAVDTTDKRLIGNGGEYIACFRKSQEKFEVLDNGKPVDFDIVSFSKPAQAKLHQPFIAIMYWLALKTGKLEEFLYRLCQMQNQTFHDILNPLLFEDEFFNVFRKLPKYFPIVCMRTENLMNEPFLRSMVVAYTMEKARLLATKTQLYINPNDGRSAFGIIDTTGSLKEGEVFFQYSIYRNPTASASKIHTGDVGVTRSPIYHAGNIRFVQAVDAPALHHLKDVLVFPACGIRPLTDQTGGGDLDGDRYLIFWNKAFLFSNSDPADYSVHGTENLARVNLDQLQEASVNHRKEYMQNDNIRSTSKTHLAHLCNLPPDHPDVERIAKKADVAVNYFKSGICAKKLKSNEVMSFNPKYMNKRHLPAFTNSNILNQLHDFSDTFYNWIKIAFQEDKNRINRYTVSGAQIIENDRKIFEEYKAEILAALNKFGISEGELFANVFCNLSATEIVAIRKAVFDIFQKYREKVLDELFGKLFWRRKMHATGYNIFSFEVPNITSEMIRRAKSYYALAQEDGTCFSFPWIIWEGLDAWWSATPIFGENNFGKKFQTELSLQLNDDENDILQNFQEPYLQYPWINTFSRIFYEWRQKYGVMISPENQHSLIRHFITERNDLHGPGLMFIEAADLFYNFLLMIPESYCCQTVLLKAAYSTLISLAFSPESNIYENLNTRIINNLPFVISVPSYWSQLFQEQYKILEEESGCEEIDIHCIRERHAYHHFTIMSRGTLEACQDLEKMLTPVVEANSECSMQDIKSQKWKAMQDLLQDIFGFPEELQYPGRITHVASDAR